MNILFLNNCESYHSGSFQVMNFFKKEFENHNLTILKSFKRLYKYNLLNFDVIVANGEGTMHDNAPKALQILNVLLEGKKLGIKTLLVNTVWQNNNENFTKLLDSIDYISVREVSSKKEIQKIINKEIDVNIDVSYFVDTDMPDRRLIYNVAAGNRYQDGSKPKIIGIGEDINIDIFSQPWNSLISDLRKSKMLVTGRHHEMYAACKAECPFLVLEGNTHKNSGFLKTMECEIPILPTNSSNKEITNYIEKFSTYESEYLKLFKKLKTIKKPNFLKNAGLV